ncbi:acyltransferase family protein [Microbacterium mangrovi]|uniref:acyltransferase family protein n=1 Tax=Microbacterium mangrovi TaxID=1348253 RepID=UPI00068F635F|nr:acyltransferase [Microbacterium mangrovi]
MHNTRFDARRNSLNAIRLGLAVMVIVAHSWPLSGRAEPQFVGEYNEPGAWAVAGFFVISGYLITMSRDRTSLGPFLWRRFLRIYPGFLVAIVLTAFVLAPVSALVTGEYSFAPAIEYVVKNLALYNLTFDIPGTLASAPFPGAWNGSLWTLFFEALCYVGIGLAVSLVPSRWLGRVLMAVLVAGTAVTAIHVAFGVLQVNLVLHLVRLGTYFAAGALMYVYHDRVPLNWLLGTAAAVAAVATVVAGTFQFLSPIPLAYLAVWAGAVLPLHRVGATSDISYGMYIYAFPVQQLLAITIGAHTSLVVFMLLSIVLTIPFAWASWRFIEQPAMRLRRLVTERRSVPARPSDAAPTR